MKKVDLKSTLAKKRIDSPLAKYNNAGQLFCVLCNCPVKSEMVWTGHVNGKSHREALTNLKASKRPASSETAMKDPKDHEFLKPPPSKKALVIHKQSISNSSPSSDSLAIFKVPLVPKQSVIGGAKNGNTSPSSLPGVNNVPAADEKEEVDDDFEEDEDMETEDTPADASNFADNKPPPVSNSTSAASQLPVGFFDDPKEDAKARGLEWRDPAEIEWENFVKEIAGEEVKSSSMRTVDDEESTKSREIDEIEEQMAHWQKVIDIERKVEEVKKVQKLKNAEMKSSTDNPDDDEDSDYDEELDWRSKRH